MNKFIDRTSELKQLNTIYEQGVKGALVVLYGRRRLGKTALLKKFCQDLPYCYFMADRAGEESLKRALALAMSESLGESILKSVDFPSWYDLFALFDKFRPKEKKMF